MNDDETVTEIHAAFVDVVDAISQHRPVTNGEAMTAAMVFIVASAKASPIGLHAGFRAEAIEMLDILLDQIKQEAIAN